MSRSAAPHFDVVIVGSGAGGGTMARALADSGARILVLERGDFVPREAENWDPTARADLETFMERLVPERDSWYTHDLEGPDDATSHIRSMLTDTSLTIPVDDGELSLGTWQGIYVFEHRAHPHRRKVFMRALSMG